jgi:hypothetical protein
VSAIHYIVTWIVTIHSLEKKKRPNPFGPSVLDELSTWKKLHLDLDLQLLPDHLTVDEAAPPLQALYGVHG